MAFFYNQNQTGLVFHFNVYRQNSNPAFTKSSKIQVSFVKLLFFHHFGKLKDEVENGSHDEKHFLHNGLNFYLLKRELVYYFFSFSEAMTICDDNMWWQYVITCFWINIVTSEYITNFLLKDASDIERRFVRSNK